MEVNSKGKIANRFTDELYAKRIDVVNSLKTNAIDPIWTKIIAYRETYYKKLPVSNVAKINYHVCYIPVILSKCSKCITDLSISLSMFEILSSEDKVLFINALKDEIIKQIAIYNKTNITIDFKKALLNNSLSNLQGLSDQNIKIINYYDLLENEFIINKINKDELINLYKKILNDSSKNNDYRQIDFKSNQNVTINPEHNGVSKAQIERIIGYLYSFTEDETYELAIRLAMIFYLMKFVKPFESYNEELSIILLKNLLMRKLNNEIIKYMPFEMFLNKYSDFNNDFKETYKSNDFTYVLLKVIEYIENVVEYFNNLLNRVKEKSLIEEHDISLKDLEEEKEKSEIPSVRKEENIPEVKVEEIKQEVKVKEIKEEVANENKLENNIEIKEIKIEKTKKPTVNPIEVKPIDSNQNLFSYVAIDEKDANKFMKYLLETNPLLKKKEAHFFSRHSTIGSYYTIQMFKNFEHVVYETARTSMDSLANLGYYRKEQIKNKFVYTPNKIERK